MTPAQLLQACEKLTHHDRMRWMVELGRQAVSDSSIGETLATLTQGDVYQRMLAIQACHGSRDSAQALRALSDPSRRVRSIALGLVVLICSDTEMQTALDMLPLDMKTVLLRRLHNRQRYAPIDRHLETLASRETEELKQFLPFGSREVVARYFGQVSQQLDLLTLSRVVRRYPDLAVAHLRTWATASENVDPRLVMQVNGVLPLLSHSAPDLALDLVKTLLAVVPFAQLNVQSLVRKRPNETADLLFQTNERSTVLLMGSRAAWILSISLRCSRVFPVPSARIVLRNSGHTSVSRCIAPASVGGAMLKAFCRITLSLPCPLRTASTRDAATWLCPCWPHVPKNGCAMPHFYRGMRLGPCLIRPCVPLTLICVEWRSRP